MQRIYCHACATNFMVGQDWDGTCPSCREGFCETLPVVQDEAPAEPPHQRHHQQQQQQHQGGYTFRLPGGGGTVHIVVGGGRSGGMGFGMGHPAPFPHGPFVSPAADPFELFQALMGGAPFGGQEFMLGGWGQDYNQEEMDRIITQIMNQYQPQSRETAKRVRDSLPRLTVRPRGEPASSSRSSGAVDEDAEMGMAAVCAGEPCSVCHDDFQEGGEVVELPCQHCFHEECLMPWLESHNTCPVCRMELPTEQGGGSGAASTSRASSRRQQQQGQAQQGGEGNSTWMGSLNQLLHGIAQRWEQAHSDESQPGSSAAGAAGAAAGAGAGAEHGVQSPRPPSRRPSSRGGEPGPAEGSEQSASRPRRLESPRTAAGRAAAARAAATWPLAEEGPQPSHSAFAQRADPPPPAVAAGAGGGGRSEAGEEEEEEGGAGALSLGAIVGGALGAVVGGALSAMLGRNRRGSGSE